MTREELIEALADAEHASWARWMDYLFSKCLWIRVANGDGKMLVEALAIPEGLVEHWKRQVATPYDDLTEREKQSDREEVAHILPAIEKYVERRIDVAFGNAPP